MQSAIDPEKFARRQARAEKARPNILARADYAMVLLLLDAKGPLNIVELLQETGFDRHHLDNMMTVLAGHDFVQFASHSGFVVLSDTGKELAAELDARAQAQVAGRK